MSLCFIKYSFDSHFSIVGITLYVCLCVCIQLKEFLLPQIKFDKYQQTLRKSLIVEKHL